MSSIPTLQLIFFSGIQIQIQSDFYKGSLETT
jgi:hypothetical protein